MIPANYQHAKSEDFNIVTSADEKVEIKIIAGELDNKYGKIKTQTEVNALMIYMQKGGQYELTIPKSHQSAIYLLNGEVIINDSQELKLNDIQLIQFNQDGDGISIISNSESRLLFLSGEPFKEPVATYGPYVMNTQTEILEAMRDYQQGKMGFLPA